MSNLEKLRAGPFRPGRSSRNDDIRQLQADLYAALNSMRDYVLALDPGAETSEVAASSSEEVAFHSYHNRGSTTALYYVPWGNQSEAATGGVDEEVLLIPPFGALSTLHEIKIWSETAAGLTDIRITEDDETLIQLETLTIPAGALQVLTVDVELSSADPILIGINPTTAMNSVVVQAIFRERAAA